jgi:hypothetical protein
MPEDAQVIIPKATTTAAGIVQLGATGGAQPTLPACAPGQLHQAGTANTTSTGTGTNTTTTLTCQNPSWITSTGTGLGTSTQGAVLYNGSTATGTNSTSSPVWGAPPAALSYGGPSAESFGASSAAGASTSVTRADHVHALPALPSASTSVAGICQYGTGSTNCMQGNTTHLSGDVATSSVGVANGVAPLGTDTKVFVNYLPFGDQHHYGIMQMSTDTATARYRDGGDIRISSRRGACACTAERKPGATLGLQP